MTGRVSQDSADENLGHHRGAGRRNEHPSLYQFGYDSNMIRMSRSIAPAIGNIKGAYQGKKKNLPVQLSITTDTKKKEIENHSLCLCWGSVLYLLCVV